MPRNGSATRDRILAATQQLVLAQGFSATTVDAILDATQLSKGAFFHHFASKEELARALVERYALMDAEHLETTMARAERLTSEPLQQLLVFVGLLQEEAETLVGDDPGCLYASFCYEQQLFEPGTRDVIASGVELWRACLVEKLEAAAATHPPRVQVDLRTLADQLLTLFEGAFVLSRAVADPAIAGQQLAHFRTYLELLFGAENTVGAG